MGWLYTIICFADVCNDVVLSRESDRVLVCGYMATSFCALQSLTVGPLIIELLRVKKRVSTGALGALDDPRVVQTKISKSGQVRVDNSYHL